jgi:uncharacterized protein YbjT (DUF2867 family)
MNHGHEFLNYEVKIANHCVDSFNKVNIGHIIYLSSLLPEHLDSEHLQARKVTGDILKQGNNLVTELRAGVIVGPGSAAFEIMRDFIFNLPILVTPKWVDSKANPIALENLNFYLLAVMNSNPSTNQVFEVGGPETLSYREQFILLGKTNGKKVTVISTQLLTPTLAAYWLGLITSVPANVGRALLAGLKHDFVANSKDIETLYPQQLLSIHDMFEKSIEHEGDYVKNDVWGYNPDALERWQPGFGYFPKQAGATMTTDKTAQDLWKVVIQLGSRKEGYFYANILWRIREWLDIFFGGGKPIRRSPSGPTLKLGDKIDSWKVIRYEEDQFLSLLFGMKGPGLGRLECSIIDHGTHRELDVRAWWHPKGFMGLLYWYAMFPAHLFIFKGMVKAICRKA